MARKPSVNYWKSRGAYDCWHRVTQHVLAVGPEDAPRDQSVATNDNNTVRVTLGSYLHFISGKVKPGTLKLRTTRYAPAQ